MHRRWMIALLAGVLAMSVHGLPAPTPAAIAIKATRKTADVRQTNGGRPGRTVERENRSVFYQFELSTMTPGLPDPLVATWVVLVEGMRDQVKVGTRGKQDINLQPNRKVTIESDDFDLHEIEVRHRGRTGSDESSVYGYGIRIYDTTGRILAEKYEPAKAERDLVEALDGKRKGEAP